MNYKIEFDCKKINFEMVCHVIKQAGLATYPLDLARKAFENSYVTIFIFDGEKLIGTGRAISDGAYQAALYDIAVLPEYQGKGIGKTIIEELHKKLTNINIILYANTTAENFYRKLGYSKMLTGMAKFRNEETMRAKGFTD